MNVTHAKDVLYTVVRTLLWCVALGVLIQNIILLRQVRVLRSQLVESGPILPGTKFEGLSGLTLEGYRRAVEMPAGDKRLLIITFSPGCPACRANQTGWDNLTSQLKEKGWDTWVAHIAKTASRSTPG